MTIESTIDLFPFTKINIAMQCTNQSMVKVMNRQE